MQDHNIKNRPWSDVRAKCLLSFRSPMFRRLILASKITLCALLFFTPPARAGWEANFPVNDFYILPAARAKEMVKQCSRPAPRNVTEVWTPNRKQIAVLEKMLFPYLDHREKEGKPIPPKNQRYHRQYVGIVVNGNDIIYGNFYLARETSRSERSTPVLVCDGGSVFWGIEFNLRTGLFENLRFNGQV